jgi:drug/metabolite transporter (DMT)-like permease
MTRTTAAAAIFLQYTSTVWAFVFGFLFLKERINRGNLVALFFAVAGIVWIIAAEQSPGHTTGNLIALASGLAYSGVMLSLRALRDEDSAWLIALNHLVSGLVLLPWVLTFHISLSGMQWLLIGLLGVFQMGLPYVLFARGVRTVSTQEAALLTLIEPILNPLWVWLCWGEYPGTATCIGGALILGGLALRYLVFPSRQAPGEHPA